ncbi:rhomboid family intramembrane serine protease [Chitinophagaceae bacterium LWZ2-11]
MTRLIRYNSPVILSYFFIALAVCVLGYLTGGKSTLYLFSVYKTSPFDPMQYVRVFTHVLGHANFNHFINNFLLILILGPMLEEKYGSKSILYMIIITAFVTGLMNIILFPTTILTGASGVVFMLILLSSFANFQAGSIPLIFILVLVIYLGQEVYSGLFSKDNISHMAHIAGGLCGAVFGFIRKR